MVLEAGKALAFSGMLMKLPGSMHGEKAEWKVNICGREGGHQGANPLYNNPLWQKLFYFPMNRINHSGGKDPLHLNSVILEPSLTVAFGGDRPYL
jgi:hypothetical protein